jgi:hypothetical protein
MDQKRKEELLHYYWNDEPVYHPTKGTPKPRVKVIKTRILAFVLLLVYLGFTRKILVFAGESSLLHWLISFLMAAFVADFLSGLTHIYIDFGTSDRKNPIHKQLFLSRVHHHELMRPARLDYASLWFFPALYSFLLLALFPAVLIWVIPGTVDLSLLSAFWLCLLWFSSISQVSHAFAHGKAKSRLAKKITRSLQRIRIFISPGSHGKHHREIDLNFCVLNGWANPLLNLIFKKCIESHVSESTSPGRQKEDMKKKLSYPYEEIL